MSKNTSIVTVFSGLLGGSTTVAQEVSAVHSTDTINFLKVAVAAAISACVGYVVKQCLDMLVSFLKTRKK